MDNVISQPNRMHPMMVAAAVSVTLVSLVGVAAITGLIPTSHGSVPATASTTATPLTTAFVAQNAVVNPDARYVSSDGKVLQEVPAQRVQTESTASAYQAAPVVHDKPVMHHKTASYYAPVARHATARYYDDPYAQNASVSRRQAVRDYNDEYAQNTYQAQRMQPQYAPQQHPVVNYVNDMHPVGTGVGAVLGGLLGNQVGGGNGKKLATVAGVLLGGYAGNEVAHNRSPLPGQ